MQNIYQTKTYVGLSPGWVGVIYQVIAMWSCAWQNTLGVQKSTLRVLKAYGLHLSFGRQLLKKLATFVLQQSPLNFQLALGTATHLSWVMGAI